MLLFHTCSGALLGRAAEKGSRDIATTIVTVVLVNSALRYLPVFVQTRLVAVEVMYFVLAFLMLGFLSFALLRPRRSTATRQG
jgi:hypothetical protein